MYFNLATQTLYYFSGGALLNLPERSGSSNPYNRRTLPEPRSTHPRRRERKKEKRREREREREREKEAHRPQSTSGCPDILPSLLHQSPPLPPL